MTFDLARRIADAVLYEGYVLYPYRASSSKNRARFQFGVLVPNGYGASGGESASMQVECLVEPVEGGTAAPVVDVRVRGLHLRTRMPAGDGTGYSPNDAESWDEGIERVINLPSLPLDSLLNDARRVDARFDGGREIEDGAVQGAATVREWRPVGVRVTVAAVALGRLFKLRLTVENVTAWPDADGARDPTGRGAALRRSLVGLHAFVHVANGSLISLLDPPAWAAAAAKECTQSGLWPVLVGEPGSRDTMLASPIILYDHPAVAPESPVDFCDGTEIDEMLALRVMTLTDEEKREARLTDERSRAIVERVDNLPREALERLHGAMRDVRPTGESAPPRRPTTEARDPGGGSVEVDGISVSRGSRVRIRPKRRADSMDVFLAGMAARVQGVYRDTDDRTWVALTAEDDPAADMHEWYGRFLYFAPDEVEPITETDARTLADAGTEPASHEDDHREAEP